MTWERRWHPLREEWVTITSHRNERPWSGSDLLGEKSTAQTYDKDCFLCPGNVRVSGEQNPDYTDIFVFDNDHPSFSESSPDVEPEPVAFFQNAQVDGICRVICYSPDHGQSLARMETDEIKGVVDCWADQTRKLCSREDVSSVLIFENKGEVVGVSNPHPHCQVYAPGFVVDGIRREAIVMNNHAEEHGRSLMADLAAAEIEDGRRTLIERETAVAFVPYFARFPYEVFIVPRQQHGYLHELSENETRALAEVIQEVLIRYDNLWQTSFPYMLVVHQAPCDEQSYDGYHCHIQIHPPMRQPGLQKYLASVETGGGHFLNDGCPEEKAAELRSVSSVHYLNT